MIKNLFERSYKDLHPSTKTKGKLLKINTAGPWYNVTFIYNIEYEQIICNQPEPGDPLGDFW